MKADKTAFNTKVREEKLDHFCRVKAKWGIRKGGVILSTHHEPSALRQRVESFGPGCEVVPL